MLASHYAPGAAVRVGATSVLPGEALLAFGQAPCDGSETAVAMLNLSPSGDLREAATNLFSYPAAPRSQRRRDHRRRADPECRPRRGDQRPALPRRRAARRSLGHDQRAGAIDPALLDRFAAIVGDAHALRAEADIAPYVHELRGLYPGRSPLVLKPGSVEEVSRILKLATETRTPIVPQGGNTGLVGGQVPHAVRQRDRACRCRG